MVGSLASSRGDGPGAVHAFDGSVSSPPKSQLTGQSNGDDGSGGGGGSGWDYWEESAAGSTMEAVSYPKPNHPEPGPGPQPERVPVP